MKLLKDRANKNGIKNVSNVLWMYFITALLMFMGLFLFDLFWN